MRMRTVNQLGLTTVIAITLAVTTARAEGEGTPPATDAKPPETATTTPAAETPPAAAVEAVATPAPTPAPALPSVPPAPVVPDEPVAKPAPAEAPSAEVEEIVVTGSRIRRKEVNTAAPVTVIGREQIQASAALTIGDFLQLLPEANGGTNTTVNNGGDGSTTISLRGLGAERTLVLVDGKRYIGGVPGGGNLGDPGVDVNSIPPAAVERIEILKDGASAVYGSDAIGGVVNIITRKKFDGVEGGITYGMPMGGATTTDAHVSAGVANDKGSVFLGAGYFSQTSLMASQRDWAKEALGYDYNVPTDPEELKTWQQVSPSGSSRIPKGRAQIDPSKCTTDLCNKLKAKYGEGKKQFIHDSTTPNETDSPVVDGWRLYLPSDSYNFQAVNFLVTPSERLSLFSKGDYHIKGDLARAYFNLNFVNRRSSNMLAPVPLDTGSFGLVYSKDNQYNPFGIDILDSRRRFTESGGRSQAQNITTFQFVAGVDGTLPFLNDWLYDVSFTHGRNEGIFTTNGSINTQLTGFALGPSKDGVCYTDNTFTAAIPNCTPANWFAPENGMTPDMVKSLGAFTGINHGANAMSIFEVNLNGALPVKFMSDRAPALALGYAHRSESGSYGFNPIAIAGYDSDYNGQNTEGSFSLNEGYAELSAPIVTGKALVELLEVSGAVRYSNYSTFGSQLTYKAAARYSPIRDFALRGTLSTGFRAPGITSLYSGTSPNAEAASDPCKKIDDPNSELAKQCAVVLKRGGTVEKNSGGSGDDNDQILSTSGGNPNLQPEKATIITAGFVLQPHMVKQLTFTADFFAATITDNIGLISTPVILAGCYPGVDKDGKPLPVNSKYCDLVLRGPNGQIRDVDDRLANVGKTQTQGIDIAARYALPTTVGAFGFSIDTTLLLQMDQTLADGTIINGAGNYDLGAMPTTKVNVGVTWANKGMSASVLARHIGSYEECANADGFSGGDGLCYQHNKMAPVAPATEGKEYPHRVVDSFTAFDLRLGYTFNVAGFDLNLALGARNLLGTDPPRVYNTSASTNSDPSVYDFLGRVVYGQLNAKI